MQRQLYIDRGWPGLHLENLTRGIGLKKKIMGGGGGGDCHMASKGSITRLLSFFKVFSVLSTFLKLSKLPPWVCWRRSREGRIGFLFSG